MNIFSDLRFVLRLFFKNKASSVMAVLVMTVGIAVATTMFAFVEGIMWSSLNLDIEEEVYFFEWSEPDKLRNNKQIHPLDFEAFQEESDRFKDMTGFRWHNYPFFNPSGTSFAKRYETAEVETNFFDIINAKPLYGRGFLPQDVKGGETASQIIISNVVWREHFQSNENAVGSIAMVAGKPRTIVGVMPEGFFFPDEVHVWIATDWKDAKEEGRKHWRRLWTIGTLKEGTSVAAAKVELNTIAKRLAAEYPETNDNLKSLEVRQYKTWLSEAVVSERFEAVCYAMLACALLVLGAASANVFNLIMTRIATRSSELSVRNAMGASRTHIVVQVVLDGLLLTAIGAACGSLIASWSLKLIWERIELQRYIPYWWRLEINSTVLYFVVGAVLISALVSSLVPGLRASKTSIAENLKDDSRTSSGLFLGTLSKVVLGFQITVTGVMAFVSVMMVLLWWQMRTREQSFDLNSVLNATVDLRSVGEGENANLLEAQFRDKLKEKIERFPEVEAVAFSFQEGGGAVQVMGEFFNKRLMDFEIDGELYELDDKRPQALMNMITEGFSDVFGQEVLEGRNITKLDTIDTEMVCVVNKFFADYYWPGESPIGKRIKLLFPEGNANPYRAIVGVLPNVLPNPLIGEDPIEGGYAKVLLPMRQTRGEWGRNRSLIVRAKGDALVLAEPLRRSLRELAPELAFHGRIMTLKDIETRNFVGKDLVFGLFAIFGLASLILGIVGLYAVVSFSTRQRYREFGIRMAIGASSVEVMRSVLRRGALLLFSGGILGIAAGHFVSVLLKESVGAHYLPLGFVYPLVAFVLLSATCLSMGLPAWRASRLSPTRAMRVE